MSIGNIIAPMHLTRSIHASANNPSRHSSRSYSKLVLSVGSRIMSTLRRTISS